MALLKERSTEVEIMDDLNCQGEVVNQTLRELEFINRWLGGNQVTLSGIQQLVAPLTKGKTFTLVDLGCGGGDMLKLIAQWGAKKEYYFFLTGIDANPHNVAFAAKNCEAFSSIRVETENIFSASLANRSFDFIIATLFTHHFSHEQLVGLLKNWQRQAQVGVVINDLHRHPLAYYSIRLLTKLFSKSKMVQYDAPLSVRRGFLRSDWIAILDAAGIAPADYTLSWKWAFRWQLIIRTGGKTA